MNRLLSILISALTLFTASAQTTVTWLTNSAGLQSLPPVSSRAVVAVGNESAGWSMWHWNAASTAETNAATVKYSGLTTGRWIESQVVSSTLSSRSPDSMVTRDYIDPAVITNASAWIKAATWGDSITSGDGSASLTNRYPAAFERFSGFDTSNGGVSGETSTQIRTRQTAASNTWTYPTIIWAGRNNYTATNTVKADIAAMVANLASVGNTNRYLVLSILNGNYSDEWVGSTYYPVLTNLNAELAATYGDHFVDIRGHLVNLYDASLTNDVTDFAHDVTPTSLRADSLHLNDNGYLAVAQFIYTNKLAQLRGSWSSTITPATLAQLLLQAPILSAPTLNGGTYIQAAAPGSALTYFPGFTADPSSTAREMNMRNAVQLKSDLSLGNVENTALSTWTGSSLITTIGTLVSGAVPSTLITGLATGIRTWLGTPSSANLAAAVTDETGTGALMFGTSPTVTGTLTATTAVSTPAIKDGSDTLLSSSGTTVQHATSATWVAQQFFAGGTNAMTVQKSGTVIYGGVTVSGVAGATTPKLTVDASNGSAITRIRHGTATLVAGTITISDANVTANTKIFPAHKPGGAGGTPGWLRPSAVSAGTSFTITSSSGTDTSTFDWAAIEP